MSETIACPFCESSEFIAPLYTGDLCYSLHFCNDCEVPFTAKTEIIERVTVHKIEGMIPAIKDNDTPTKEEFAEDIGDNSFVKGDNCGTHPDPETFHCQECGFIYPISMKCNTGSVCQACEADTSTQSYEQTEPDYTQLAGSKTVSYHIKEDVVCLKYKDSCCGGYTFDIIWQIIDSPKSTWTRQCDATVEGEKNAIQKATALHQFCKAIDRGDVTLPEAL